MSRFYADIKGNRGSATRQGSPDSGIRAHPRGWNVGVLVQGYADGEADEFHIYATGGSNRCKLDKLIAVVRREPNGRIEIESRIVPAIEEDHSDTCQRCSSPLSMRGRCSDETCPYSDRAQDEPFTED